jgi:hypothetical protein
VFDATCIAAVGFGRLKKGCGVFVGRQKENDAPRAPCGLLLKNNLTLDLIEERSPMG